MVGPDIPPAARLRQALQAAVLLEPIMLSMLNLVPLFLFVFIAINVVIMTGPQLSLDQTILQIQLLGQQVTTAPVGTETPGIPSVGTAAEVWRFTVGDLILTIGLFALYAEVVKATRATTSSVINHVLSLVLFIVALLEFLLVPSAGNSVFFLVMVMIFVDVIAGFTISISAARRDITFGGS